MAKLLYGILFAITFLFDGYLTEKPNPPSPPNPPKPPPPINQLASIITAFNTTELCNHICDAVTWFDDSGRVHISFKTLLNAGENSDDLCNCMYNYINQKNWLVDITHKCCVDYTSVNTFTMALDGPPNPDKTGVTPASEPVAALAAVLKQYPTADLGKHKCTSSSTRDNDGLTHIVLLCELTCESPVPNQVCLNIVAYLNQGNWLGDIKTNCSSKRFDLTLEIIGK